MSTKIIPSYETLEKLIKESPEQCSENERPMYNTFRLHVFGLSNGDISKMLSIPESEVELYVCKYEEERLDIYIKRFAKYGLEPSRIAFELGTTVEYVKEVLHNC